MKGKIFILLFALPFFGVGVWAGYSIASNMLEAREMRQWQPVSATLSQAGYRPPTISVFAVLHLKKSNEAAPPLSNGLCRLVIQSLMEGTLVCDRVW